MRLKVAFILPLWDFVFKSYEHLKLNFLENIIVTLSSPSDSGFRTFPLMRYFVAKSLNLNQIFLFRLFPPFSLFQRSRLLNFPALD